MYIKRFYAIIPLHMEALSCSRTSRSYFVFKAQYNKNRREDKDGGLVSRVLLTTPFCLCTYLHIHREKLMLFAQVCVIKFFSVCLQRKKNLHSLSLSAHIQKLNDKEKLRREYYNRNMPLFMFHITLPARLQYLDEPEHENQVSPPHRHIHQTFPPVIHCVLTTHR